MADDSETLREIRNLLRRQEARAAAKPNAEMNALIRKARRGANAEAAGLATPDDPLRPTKAEINAKIAELESAGQHHGYRTLASSFGVSVGVIRSRLGKK